MTPLSTTRRVPGEPAKYREPDLMFLAAAYLHRVKAHYWDGADLVMGVVSGSAADRRRDLVVKRGEYARAGISEYWLIDPDEAQITILTLAGDDYSVHGVFPPGSMADSILLPGFSLDVAAVLDAATT